MQSRDSLSNERPLSGVELAVATVAQWPDADGHKTAIYRPVLEKANCPSHQDQISRA